MEHKNEQNSKKVPNLREIAENFSPECRDAILDYADQLDNLNIALYAKERVTAEVMDLTEDECAEVLKYYYTMSRIESGT